MAEWIAFDEPGATALGALTGTEATVASGDPMALALTAGVPSMLVLPASTRTVRVLAIRPGVQTATQSRQSRPKEYVVATGFLGLSDEIVDDEPGPSRKSSSRNSWWRKRRS